MSARVPVFVALDRALDGARIAYRHFLSTRPPVEGWVKEFSKDGSLVRISRTHKLKDAGTWHRVYDLRVEAVLEAAAAPTDAGEDDAGGDS